MNEIQRCIELKRGRKYLHTTCHKRANRQFTDFLIFDSGVSQLHIFLRRCRLYPATLIHIPFQILPHTPTTNLYPYDSREYHSLHHQLRFLGCLIKTSVYTSHYPPFNTPNTSPARVQQLHSLAILATGRKIFTGRDYPAFQSSST